MVWYSMVQSGVVLLKKTRVVSGSQEYLRSWPFGLLSLVLGHYILHTLRLWGV